MADITAADTRHLIGPAITDVAGEPATTIQIARLVQRYSWVASYCDNRKVLEVACGTGQGLGLLLERARDVYGCDLSFENLSITRRTYGASLPLVQADAQTLPFAGDSLDVVIMLETLYFLPDAAAFLQEARRILRPGGWCLVSVINKDCPDFNPNHPLYFERYGIRELSRAFELAGFQPSCFGIVPMDRPTLRSRMFAPIKKLAVGLNLIPESMQARQALKRIVFGKLQRMPADIGDLPPPAVPPQPLPLDRADSVHQVILCAGTVA